MNQRFAAMRSVYKCVIITSSCSSAKVCFQQYLPFRIKIGRISSLPFKHIMNSAICQAFHDEKQKPPCKRRLSTWTSWLRGREVHLVYDFAPFAPCGLAYYAPTEKIKQKNKPFRLIRYIAGLSPFDVQTPTERPHIKHVCIVRSFSVLALVL